MGSRAEAGVRTSNQGIWSSKCLLTEKFKLKIAISVLESCGETCCWYAEAKRVNAGMANHQDSIIKNVCTSPSLIRDKASCAFCELSELESRTSSSCVFEETEGILCLYIYHIIS